MESELREMNLKNVNIQEYYAEHFMRHGNFATSGFVQACLSRYS